MMIDWDFVFACAIAVGVIAWLYWETVVRGGPGCSGDCQQGRQPCNCPLKSNGEIK